MPSLAFLLVFLLVFFERLLKSVLLSNCCLIVMRPLGDANSKEARVNALAFLLSTARFSAWLSAKLHLLAPTPTP